MSTENNDNKDQNDLLIGKKVIEKEIEIEVKKSYLDYAMSVIVSRALPDVRDGLKPVHRRILFAMHDMGMFHNKPYKKCARIVGEVLGKYHPHGDSSVYGALVRMAQDFSLRYPLIHGQGNFGSVDGDSPAAMRYTEARLQKLAEELLTDIDKETVSFVENFDASLKEPTVLPVRIPNLLVNGVSGIAVGMATNIPPHNLTDTCTAIINQIENPEISISELIATVKGPDFPTGGTIIGKNGIHEAYAHGKGKIKVRSKTKLEENKIIVQEIPYAVNKSILIQEIAFKVKNKIIEGITDIRDESDKRGTRIVIVCKKDVSSDYVLNQLYKYTNLQVTFGINMLALVNNEPKLLNLKELNSHFINHRKEVITNKTKFELNKAEERKHILEGLIIALDNIDEIIRKIKNSKDVKDAVEVLKLDYSLTEIQSKAILDMKLQKLANLEQEKIRKEHASLIELIKELNDILNNVQRIYQIIKDELEEIISKYGDDRKTDIIEDEYDDILIEDLIKEEEVVVTISNKGYVKRTPLNLYKSQNRGGKGITAAKTTEDDFIENIYVTNTHNHLLIFTNKGKVYWLKVYQLPDVGRSTKGKPIINLIPIEKDEKVNSIIPVSEFTEKNNIVMITEKGIIKKTNLMNFSRPRKNGIIAVVLNDNDILVKTILTSEDDQLVIATSNGLASRILEKSLRQLGRVSKGVRGIRLKEDKVIGMVKANSNDKILTVSEKGYGKKTPLEDYRLINRGGKGVINLKVNDKTGHAISLHKVTEDEELILISKNGISIRTSIKNISVIGRNTQGVRIMKLKEDDFVVSSAIIFPENSEEFKEINSISEDIASKM